MTEDKPVKVAIIGGGIGGITAAFELSRPQHQGRYQISLYQLGWRLGGKGASGRGRSDRIEEHGLHIWMGSYENAFRLIRECYAELNRDPKKCHIANWRDAFFPAPFVGLAAPRSDKTWTTFLSYFPPGDGEPGDPFTHDQPFSVSSYLIRCASLIRTILMTVQIGKQTADGAESQVSLESDDQSISAQAQRLFNCGYLGTMAGFIQLAGLVQTMLSRGLLYPENIILRLIELAIQTAQRLAQDVVASNPELELLWQVIELSLGTMRGIVRFGLLTDPRGFDAINDYDTRDWLRINGVSEKTLNSALVRGMYDLAFAYEEGDFARPRHAAGVGLRGTLRMLFSSRGALFWKMRAGMGDIVFAPYYEVLRRRGVRFEFFHRLQSIRLAGANELAAGEQPFVKALEFDVQAALKSGEYNPLIDVRGLPCWPAQPDFSQLIGGELLRRRRICFESHWDRHRTSTKTLNLGQDFDCVVLAIGLGAIPYVCGEIVERDQRWREMVKNLKTIATQAFQIWIREDMEGLGWQGPPVCLSAFEQPFDTWADMSHLLAEESWTEPPGALAYFCSAMPEPEAAPSARGYRARAHAIARRDAIRFLNHHIRYLWPRAVDSAGKFRWDLVVDPARSDKNRTNRDSRSFDSQYWTANVEPSERYVLSLPGTTRYRISPLDNTYDNLTIAGDWTANGLDVGCVEAATMAGLLAAHAISGSPALEDIVAYDHP